MQEYELLGQCMIRKRIVRARDVENAHIGDLGILSNVPMACLGNMLNHLTVGAA